MQTKVITTSADLAEFCASFGDEKFITVDTEFIRERTYYPQLCLMQIATSKLAVAVDPLAGEIDFKPLYDAFQNPNLLKVFHAAKQDIEIFVRESGHVPMPMYDTQIAAMVCGFGESVSYETLVGQLVGAKLDKASRFTDWARRPLSDRQLVYALDDVIHLRVVYEKLSTQIHDEGRDAWIEEEMQEMAEASQYTVDPQMVWKRLKPKTRSTEYLQLLRAAAAWREEQAMKRDLPRQRVLKDDWVVQVAAQAPKSADDLMEVRGIGGQLSKDAMASLVEALNIAAQAPRDTFPIAEDRLKPMPAAQEGCLDQLKLLLRQKAEQYHTVPRLVADKEELEMLVRGLTPFEKTHFSHGWRYDVFGEAAKDLLDGKLSARVVPFKGGYGLMWTRPAVNN
jgi:ribonuclease D